MPIPGWALNIYYFLGVCSFIEVCVYLLRMRLHAGGCDLG